MKLLFITLLHTLDFIKRFLSFSSHIAGVTFEVVDFTLKCLVLCHVHQTFLGIDLGTDTDSVWM